MAESRAAFDYRQWLGPRHWPTWLAFGLFYLVSRLSFERQLGLGRRLGRVLYRLLPARRRVSLTNLRLAFPELPAAERHRIAEAAFEHAGAAAAETACTWYRPLAYYAERFDFAGDEHLTAAVARGRGVILLQAHFTAIDIPSGVMNRRWPVAAVYDDPKNALYSAYITHQRLAYMDDMIDNRDIRSMVRRLRKGGIVWYSPDQTVKRERGGIPTRYFGQPVLTTAGTARIAAMTGAAVVPYQPIRHIDAGRYTLKFSAPLELDTDNLSVATQQVNDLFEAQVRQTPDQYLWAHKRFKPSRSDLPDPYRAESQAGRQST